MDITPNNPDYSPLTLIAKAIGVLIAFLSLRWIVKIFKGDDKILSVDEFLKLGGVLFFSIAGGYMLWKEGNREHQWYIYSEWYIAIVFGALLTVLHLDSAMDKIIQLAKAIKGIKDDKPEEKPAQ